MGKAIERKSRLSALRRGWRAGMLEDVLRRDFQWVQDSFWE